jgi:hypothetical protein
VTAGPENTKSLAVIGWWNSDKAGWDGSFLPETRHCGKLLLAGFDAGGGGNVHKSGPIENQSKTKFSDWESLEARMSRGRLRGLTPLLRGCTTTRLPQIQHVPVVVGGVARGKGVSVLGKRYQSGVAQITDQPQQMNQQGNTILRLRWKLTCSCCSWRGKCRWTHDAV